MKNILLIILMLIEWSCASYTCKEYPTGRCQSVSSVYENSKKPNFLSQNESENEVKNQEAIKSKTTKVEKNQNQNLNSPLTAINFELVGKPIIKNPKVLRILINHWEDEDKDLNIGGHIYLRVEEAKWEIQ
jgi:hypothetical protein